jgi:hypothetical protein
MYNQFSSSRISSNCQPRSPISRRVPSIGSLHVSFLVLQFESFNDNNQLNHRILHGLASYSPLSKVQFIIFWTGGTQERLCHMTWLKRWKPIENRPWWIILMGSQFRFKSFFARNLCEFILTFTFSEELGKSEPSLLVPLASKTPPIRAHTTILRLYTWWKRNNERLHMHGNGDMSADESAWIPSVQIFQWISRWRDPIRWWIGSALKHVNSGQIDVCTGHSGGFIHIWIIGCLLACYMESGP